MFILSSTSQSNVTEKFENEEGKEDEPFIDVGKTFLEAYRSLSPKQIENMTSDTKELIDTQKALLQTIQSLAPIVTEGRQMLQSFQSTFGDQQSIMNQIKNAKSLLGFNNASKKEEDEQFSNS
jgi:hypothetical protein